MWLLTLSATMGGLALLDEMSRPQAIHAEVVRFQCGHHLIVCKGLEAHTGIQWMFLTFAENAIGSRIRGVGCEGCYRVGGLSVVPHGVRFVPLSIG